MLSFKQGHFCEGKEVVLTIFKGNSPGLPWENWNVLPSYYDLHVDTICIHTSLPVPTSCSQEQADIMKILSTNLEPAWEIHHKGRNQDSGLKISLIQPVIKSCSFHLLKIPLIHPHYPHFGSLDYGSLPTPAMPSSNQFSLCIRQRNFPETKIRYHSRHRGSRSKWANQGHASNV